ncbi:hypothetical protein BV22DRAFT_1076831 [Leucogyrophana mollusca]|uniref:Uncharacterized protein n=1 Tax=Leucogyrophana mollusca TaxID=85980 RepID=A0ACB8AW16_9AGAM|nr:hypothetical protein BV22DRAFT_1076831 [Leucogyrophana mollusca]
MYQISTVALCLSSIPLRTNSVEYTLSITRKIYGLSFSTSPPRVAVVCKETKIELISVDLTKGKQRAPSFTTHQPFGQVPYLVRPPLRLFHPRSRAVCSEEDCHRGTQDDDGFI